MFSALGNNDLNKYGRGGDGGAPSNDVRYGNDGKDGGSGYVLIEW